MSQITISLSKDFAPFPAGRYKKDGPYTGQGFREDILVPALRKFDSVKVLLDGKLGYGSSFLEEAFGGLVRENGFTEEELKRKLTLEGKRASIVRSALEYISNAQLETIKSDK